MSELTNNNVGSEEGSGTNTNPNERGINMETVIDQQTQNNNKEEESTMTNTTKTRGPYDGSYAHGVTADIKHITTILEYKKALDRLKTRRNYLVKEYQNLGRKYAETEDVIERAELLKDKSSKESQIKTVDKTRKDLEDLEDSIKSAERAAQDRVSFEPYEIED